MNVEILGRKEASGINLFKIIKNFIFKILVSNIVIGAIAGVLFGIIFLFVGYAICDLYSAPYATQIIESEHCYKILMTYFCGWAIAGIVAKVLPW